MLGADSPRWVSGRLTQLLTRQVRQVAHKGKAGFLASKTVPFSRQLADPLAIATATLPEWCRVLARGARFIFGFEARQLLLKSGFGPSRALHRFSTPRGGGGGFGGGGGGERGRPHQALLIEKAKVPRGAGFLEASMRLLAAHGAKRYDPHIMDYPQKRRP